MDVGIVSRSFSELTGKEAAALMADHGIVWTEICFCHADAKYWVYNGRSDLSGLTDVKSRGIVSQFQDRGITVTAIGVFTNLIETDPAEREKNLDYFERHMEIAANCGVSCVSTECGFRPESRGIQAGTYEEDFARLIESLEELARRAEGYGVDIALEPCVLDVVPSAKRMADLIDQLESRRLKVLLDPANLIANSSEEDMFSYLAPHVAYFHGKDRKVNDAYGRAVGDGDIDWPLFFELYRKHTPHLPFILEYVNRENFLAVRDRALSFAARGPKPC